MQVSSLWGLGQGILQARLRGAQRPGFLGRGWSRGPEVQRAEPWGSATLGTCPVPAPHWLEYKPILQVSLVLLAGWPFLLWKKSTLLVWWGLQAVAGPRRVRSRSPPPVAETNGLVRDQPSEGLIQVVRALGNKFGRRRKV